MFSCGRGLGLFFYFFYRVWVRSGCFDLWPPRRWAATHQVLHGWDELLGKVRQATEGRANLRLPVGVTVHGELLHGVDVLLQVRHVVWNGRRAGQWNDTCVTMRARACMFLYLALTRTWLLLLSSSSVTPSGHCPGPDQTHTAMMSGWMFMCMEGGVEWGGAGISLLTQHTHRGWALLWDNGLQHSCVTKPSWSHHHHHLESMEISAPRIKISIFLISQTYRITCPKNIMPEQSFPLIRHVLLLFGFKFWQTVWHSSVFKD